MSIKQPFIFGLGVIAGAFFLYFLCDRVWFLAHADRTTGEVVSVSKHNATCGRRRARYSCTKYDALVDYQAEGSHHRLEVTAGTKRGRNQPKSYSRYRVGADVPIVYLRGKPREAYRDEFSDVWGAPLIALLFQLAGMLGGMQEERRGKDKGGGSSGSIDPGIDFNFGD